MCKQCEKSTLKWFIKESKKFMEYGTKTPKRVFWMAFPFAYFKFLRAMYKDKKNILRKAKH